MVNYSGERLVSLFWLFSFNARRLSFSRQISVCVCKSRQACAKIPIQSFCHLEGTHLLWEFLPMKCTLYQGVKCDKLIFMPSYLWGGNQNGHARSGTRQTLTVALTTRIFWRRKYFSQRTPAHRHSAELFQRKRHTFPFLCCNATQQRRPMKSKETISKTLFVVQK